MTPNSCSQSATADETAIDKDSTWALHRGTTNMHRCFQTSMFNTDHHITTFCVLSQHSTVERHTVPWLHIALNFSRTEWCPCIYCSHSSNTMVKGKDVPVYTMKTFRGSTVTAAVICNLSRKQKWVINLMHQLFQRWGRKHKIYWTGHMGLWAVLMFWREGKFLISGRKQTTYGPASRLSLYSLSCQWK
jgi:hypothetical protein